MKTEELVETAKRLIAPGKGLLAMDESGPTIKKRFEQINLPSTESTRQQYREMILTTPNLNRYISGVILHDETIRQNKSDGTAFTDCISQAGIIIGIKVDKGAKNLAAYPNEKITEGLDGLRERLIEYHQLGARFAKWRAVINIGEHIPTIGCIEANAHVLARYAALCQEIGLLPVVEPEVLMDGDHSLYDCFSVTEDVLHIVFKHLHMQHVTIEAMLLKPNMVVPGLQSSEQVTIMDVAQATVKCLLRTVPAAVPGVVFLSGGQSEEMATAHLNEMNLLFKVKLPWTLSFSYARAIQHSALNIWQGKDYNVKEAQSSLLRRARYNSEASEGKYNPNEDPND